MKFWNDGTVESLSAHAKLLMLYFITNPYRNESGLYSITLKRMSDDTGLTPSQRDRALEELKLKERVFYDPAESIVWIVNAIRHASLNGNCRKSVRTDIEFCPSKDLSGSLLSYYASIGYSWVTEGFGTPEEPIHRVQGIGYRVQGRGERPAEEKAVFQPPTFEEFKIYFVENGFTEALATRAFKGYAEATPPWTDSRGKKVINWKQKAQHVWFNQENRNGNPKGNNGHDSTRIAAKPGKYRT